MGTPRILVIGLGTLGRALTDELRRRRCRLTVADLDSARIDRIKDEVEKAVTMDSTDGRALEELEATDFDHVIVCLGGSFEAAERTTLLLEDLGAKNVINAATTRQRGEILKKLGSHRVVTPGLLQARNLAVELSSEEIESYRWIDDEEGLVEIVLTAPLELSVAEAEAMLGPGMRLVAVGRKQTTGRRDFSCDFGEGISAEAGDSLLVFGAPDDVSALARRKLR